MSNKSATIRTNTTDSDKFRALIQGVLDHSVAATTCVHIILYTGKAVTSPTEFTQCVEDFSDQVRSHLTGQVLRPGSVLSDYMTLFKRFSQSVLFLTRALYQINAYLENRFRDMESSRNRAAAKKDPEPLPPVPVRKSIQLICYQIFNDVILQNSLATVLNAFFENITNFRMSELTDMDHPLAAAFMDPLRSVVASIVVCGEILGMPDLYVSKIKEPVFQAVNDFYSGKGLCIENIHEYITTANDWISKERKLCDTVILEEYRTAYTDTVCDLIINEKLADILSVNILSFTTDQLMCVYNLMSYASRRETLYQSFSVGVTASITEAIAEEVAKCPDHTSLYKSHSVIETFISMYSKYTLIISVAFSGDHVMYANLMQAMRGTVNQNGVNTEARPDAIAVLLSKYVNWLLTTTTVDSAELESMLLMSSKMYEFISGKDVFHKYFKNDFKTRTLEQKSTSDDLEQKFILYITPVCVDPTFLRDVSVMRADYVNSKVAASKYTLDPDSSMKVDPLIVTPCVWPFSRSYELRSNLPESVRAQITRFEEYYGNLHNGMREIMWLHEHSAAEVKITINAKTYNVCLTMFQYIFLEVLFRNPDPKSVLKLSTVEEVIGLPEEYVFAICNSLAGTNLIQRNPRDTPVTRDTKVRINPSFQNTGRKLNAKIKYRPPQEKKVDAELEQQIIRDRDNAIKCAIVRIMKTRKSMDLDPLVSETMTQIVKYFPTTAPIIRRQLEVLVNMTDNPLIAKNDSKITYLA